MSHGSRLERRKIPRPRRQDRAGGQRKLGVEVAGPTKRTCSHHRPRNTGQNGLCARPHSCRLPHPSKPSASALGKSEPQPARAWPLLSAPLRESAAQEPAGLTQISPALDPHGSRGGFRPPERPPRPFRVLTGSPYPPHSISRGMSHSVRMTLSRLEGTAKILNL